jgi:hypothetical protein
MVFKSSSSEKFYNGACRVMIIKSLLFTREKENYNDRLEN